MSPNRCPRGLRREWAAIRLLGLRVRLRPGACLSVVSVVCCLVEVCATGRSLVQGSLVECGMSECDREAVLMRSWPTGAIVERRCLTCSSIRSNVTVWWSSVDGVLLSADRQSCHELRHMCTGIGQICADRQVGRQAGRQADLRNCEM